MPFPGDMVNNLQGETDAGKSYITSPAGVSGKKCGEESVVVASAPAESATLKVKYERRYKHEKGGLRFKRL